MYTVHTASNSPTGASVPIGWKIVVVRGTPYYVKENNYDHEHALAYLRNRVQPNQQ